MEGFTDQKYWIILPLNASVFWQALGVSADLKAEDILNKMDADKNGTIDQTEWEQHMTPELRAAIEAKLQDSGIVAGFKPLVDIARVSNILNREFSLTVISFTIDVALSYISNFSLPWYQVFDQLDADKSGDLDRTEIKNALVCLGLADQFDLDKLVAALDTDANGSISIEEFKAGIPKEVLQAMSSKLNEKGLIEGLAA